MEAFINVTISNLSTDTHLDQSDEVYALLSVVLALVLLMVALVGSALNGLSVYVFTRPVMRSSVNVLLAGLSAIDFALLLMAVPVFVVPVLLQWHGVQFYVYQAVVLKCVYPVNMIAQTSSVLTMVVITCERWIAVCQPLQIRYYCSVHKSRLALLTVVLVSVGYNVVRFWEYRLSWHNNGTELGLAYGLRIQPDYMLWYFSGAYLVTHFVVPFSLLLGLNGHSCYTILKMRRARRQLTRQERGEQRTTLMMLLIVCIFAVCNTLPFVLNFVEAMRKDFFTHERTRNVAIFANDLSNLLVVVNSATTALVYYMFSQKYRRLFRNIFPCTKSKNPLQSTVGGSTNHGAPGGTRIRRSQRSYSTCASITTKSSTVIHDRTRSMLLESSPQMTGPRGRRLRKRFSCSFRNYLRGATRGRTNSAAVSRTGGPRMTLGPAGIRLLAPPVACHTNHAAPCSADSTGSRHQHRLELKRRQTMDEQDVLGNIQLIPMTTSPANERTTSTTSVTTAKGSTTKPRPNPFYRSVSDNCPSGESVQSSVSTVSAPPVALEVNVALPPPPYTYAVLPEANSQPSSNLPPIVEDTSRHTPTTRKVGRQQASKQLTARFLPTTILVSQPSVDQVSTL